MHRFRGQVVTAWLHRLRYRTEGHSSPSLWASSATVARRGILHIWPFSLTLSPFIQQWENISSENVCYFLPKITGYQNWNPSLGAPASVLCQTVRLGSVSSAEKPEWLISRPDEFMSMKSLWKSFKCPTNTKCYYYCEWWDSYSRHPEETILWYLENNGLLTQPLG